MDNSLFYKNDKVKWRWENETKIIIYYNAKWWILNETASLIFYYCEGTDVLQIVEFLGQFNWDKSYLILLISRFLNVLIREGVVISRSDYKKVTVSNDLISKRISFKFMEPKIKSFDLGSMDHLKFDRPSSPLRVFFTITHDCNLKCIHCYNLPQKNDNFKIDLSRVKDIIDRMKEAGVLEVILTGGEPFLNLHIFDIIDYILLRGIKVMINTNGLLLRDEHIDEFKKRKDITLSLGIDGVFPKTNDFIRGKGSFKKAIEILKKLSKERINIYIGFTATHKNFFDILKLRRFFRDFNVSRVIVNIFIRTGRGYEYSNILALNKLEFGLLKCLAYFNANMNTKPIVTVITSCNAGHIEANIDYRGDMFFCELLHYPLANILVEDIKKIWNSPRILSLMDADKFDSHCKICFFRRRCKGSCRAEVFSATGNLYAGNPYCFKGNFFNIMRTRSKI